MDGKTLRCRPVREEDFPYLFRVLKENMQACYAAAFGGWQDEEEQGFLRRELSEAPYHLLLSGDAPIGFFSVVEQEDALFLRELQIAKSEQGRGAGTRFLQALARHGALCQKGVRLEVLPANERAVLWYGRLGFCLTGRSATHLQMERRAEETQ